MKKDAKFFNVSSRTSDSAVIDIDGTIGGWDWDTWERINTGKLIRKQLRELKDVKNIEVHITSLGGDVDQALQIHDALKDHPATVTTFINGFCASAATIIALAGDIRKISKNAFYLIHKCSSYASGNEHDLEMELESQRTCNDILLSMYQDVCKKKKDELDELFDYDNGKGKWITAQEAVDFGFCTEIYNDESSSSQSVKVAMADEDMLKKLNYPSMPGEEPGNDDFVPTDREIGFINRIIEKARTLFAPINNTEPIINQNQTEMKKFAELFACISALLDIGNEQEYNEAEGRVMMNDEISMIESELKAYQDAKTEIEALKAERDSLKASVETITAERDDFKAKWEAAPAPVATVNGNDTKDECKLDDEYYAQIEKELSLM